MGCGPGGCSSTGTPRPPAPPSPNGNWVVYQSFDSGKYEVYVERFPELDGRQPVSGSEGGFNPVWSRDGTEVFYRRLSDGAMMAVRMQSATALAVGRPELLFNDPRLFNLTPPRPGGPADRSWDVGPDGRFLLSKDLQDRTAFPPVRLVHVQTGTRR